MMVGERFIFIAALLIGNTAASALHGECLKDEHCGTFDTYCKNGTCVCREHFAVVFDTCIQVPTPVISCLRKTECQALLGVRSICKDAMCACKSFHHLYSGQCIKSRGLDEMCEFDHQCYCGQDCGDKMECANRMCRCKPGHRQHNRRCISNSSTFSTYSLILLGATIFVNIRNL